MARKRHSAERIVNKLRHVEVELSSGRSVTSVCKLLGMTEQTRQCLRKEYGGLKTDQAKKLKELEKENAQLKRVRHATGTSPHALDETVYYCQNWRSDVVAIIDHAGSQLEHVRYSPYGVPFLLPIGDEREHVRSVRLPLEERGSQRKGGIRFVLRRRWQSEWGRTVRDLERPAAVSCLCSILFASLHLDDPNREHSWEHHRGSPPHPYQAIELGASNDRAHECPYGQHVQHTDMNLRNRAQAEVKALASLLDFDRSAITATHRRAWQVRSMEFSERTLV